MHALRFQTTRPQQGFTLVELVVVMAVLGILSLGSVYFIANASDGYAATQDREALASRGRFALERMVRSVRNALPGSVRVSSSCVELVPIASGSSYVSLPTATPASQFRAVPPNVPGLTGKRVAVAPNDSVYSPSALSVLSPASTVSAVGASGEVTVSFPSAHQFPAGSVGRRLFWVDEPVSYCADGGRLWRYENYGFNATQPSVASLPNNLPNRSLLADGVQVSFAMASASLQRNAVLDINMQLQQGDTNFAVDASVQVRNVP